MITENNTHHRKAVIVGILFIIATAFLFIGGSFYGPILDGPDFLEVAFPNQNAAFIGILIEFTCILAIPLIPVFAFPIFRKHDESLAIAYIVFRLFEAVIFLLVDITKLSLVNVSELFLSADSTGVDAIVTIGSVIRGWNEWSWFFYVLIFGTSGVILYLLLFRSRLLPRWLSIWGLISIVMMVSSAFLSMFGADLPEALFGLLVMPIAVQEMVMAMRLILKGFNPVVDNA